MGAERKSDPSVEKYRGACEPVVHAFSLYFSAVMGLIQPPCFHSPVPVLAWNRTFCCVPMRFRLGPAERNLMKWECNVVRLAKTSMQLHNLSCVKASIPLTTVYIRIQYL